MYEVVRVSSISRSQPVYVSLGEVNRLTTRDTRDANDFVHVKRLPRKKSSASRVPRYEEDIADPTSCNPFPPSHLPTNEDKSTREKLILRASDEA